MNNEQNQEASEITEVLALKDMAGWQRIVKDAQTAFDGVSMSWYNFPDGSPELVQARVSAISNRYIIDLMSLYESKINDIGFEVIASEPNSNIQIHDVDSGVVEEEDDDVSTSAMA